MASSLFAFFKVMFQMKYYKLYYQRRIQEPLLEAAKCVKVHKCIFEPSFTSDKF